MPNWQRLILMFRTMSNGQIAIMLVVLSSLVLGIWAIKKAKDGHDWENSSNPRSPFMTKRSYLQAYRLALTAFMILMIAGIMVFMRWFSIQAGM